MPTFTGVHCSTCALPLAYDFLSSLGLMKQLWLLSIPISLGLGLIKLVPIELFVAYELKPHLAYDSLSGPGLMKQLRLFLIPAHWVWDS